MLSRRKFNRLLIQSSLLSSLGLHINAEGGNSVPNPGVQLYTVRDLLEHGPRYTFESLSAMGFTHAEWFDVTTLKSLGPMAQSSGLEISSCHILVPYLTDQPEKLLDKLAEFGVSNLVLGYLLEEERLSLDQYKRLIDQLNKFGGHCLERDIRLAYHNHAFEFDPMEGVRPFDLMIDHLSSELVSFELDVFWLRFAGLDPAAMIRRLGNRCTMLHLKDLKLPPTPVAQDTATPDMFVELGKGEIDLPAVLAAAKEVGVSQYYIEQDWAAGNPLDSLQHSLKYFRSIL